MAMALEQGQKDSDCNGNGATIDRVSIEAQCVCFISRINVMDCG
jgi:hypothetical protein